jgi:hypothetical protein
MKITKSFKTEEYHDIEIEYKYLWFFTYRKEYRKIKNGNTMCIMGKNGYIFYEIGFSEFVDAYNAFNSIITNIK